MQRFEAYLKANLPVVESFHPHYNNALSEMLLAGGKRFRPMLLLSVVDAYEPLLYEGALAPALAIEFLHTYSLIHDDLPSMDNADLRRGFPTLHTTYDEATAILAGDALNSEAFYHISKAPLRDDIKIKLVELLARDGGTYGMVLGQAIDLHFENQLLTLEQVKILHTNKTAKLIATSLLMGAIIVGLEKKKQDELYHFGLDLGLLFQIQDDIIDETQSDEEAGKTTGNDGDKNSFVNIIGLDKSIEEAEVLANNLEGRFKSFDKSLQKVLNPIIEQYLYRHR
ncbi:MAG TPA: polyprenyl synthetase family protein [Campylobacterales bacterium]|nr:polyprenyl synthetase family protein [Campylobacterales bacterium]HIP41088.1 polyprenyl synthetase family protein [Campylobacterales bacterium]